MIRLTKECSTLLQKKLSPKLRDPGIFLGLVVVVLFDKVVCDLGESINLVSFSIYNKLGLREVKPTMVSLQLADKSIKHPRGVVEDVLIKEERLIFQVDFIILDMEEDREVPLILGRLFLATGGTLIDIHQGKIILRVKDEQVEFNVYGAMKYPSELDTCFEISILDDIVVETLEENYRISPLGNCSVNSRIKEDEIKSEEIRECLSYLNVLPSLETPYAKRFKEIGFVEVQSNPPIKELHTLELKPLPSHLRYAFLEDSKYFTIIINASLSDLEEEKLLRGLRQYKKAIGWSITDIKGYKSLNLYAQDSHGG
ncbi:uncharacterized protein LOC116141858 [Pistacia vera]|uniref:uncharacterized protein LOC116141858 n=1 Tax=Pistacia vera TaxID=55513 RepID=UPI0012634701|nr:uncharacterized protein LOC116141858 [Pistacia vera]